MIDGSISQIGAMQLRIRDVDVSAAPAPR